MTTLLNLESVSYLFDDLQIVNDMKNYNLIKTGTDIQVYTPPVCEAILVGIHRGICASETEKVVETEGEW